MGSRTLWNGVLWIVAPRDTFNGVGVGRKTGSEAGEAVRWGHFFLCQGPTAGQIMLRSALGERPSEISSG